MINQILAILIFIPLLFSTPTISFRGHVFSIANQNGDPNYISTAPDTVTRYELAQSNAYLAYNPGAGAYFAELVVGDTVVVADKMYTVIRIDYYRISGDNFIDVATGAVYDAAGLWSLYYTDPNLLILQTCTTGYDGRMFVVGE